MRSDDGPFILRISNVSSGVARVITLGGGKIASEASKEWGPGGLPPGKPFWAHPSERRRTLLFERPP